MSSELQHQRVGQLCCCGHVGTFDSGTQLWEFLLRISVGYQKSHARAPTILSHDPWHWDGNRVLGLVAESSWLQPVGTAMGKDGHTFGGVNP